MWTFFLSIYICLADDTISRQHWHNPDINPPPFDPLPWWTFTSTVWLIFFFSPWLSHHRTIVSACLWCVVTMAVVSRSWHKRIGMWFCSTVWRRRAIGRLSTLWRSWRSATTSSSTCSSPSSSKDSLPRYRFGFNSPLSLEILLVLFSIWQQSAKKSNIFLCSSPSFVIGQKKEQSFTISFTPHGLVGSWHILRGITHSNISHGFLLDNFSNGIVIRIYF